MWFNGRWKYKKKKDQSRKNQQQREKLERKWYIEGLWSLQVEGKSAKESLQSLKPICSMLQLHYRRFSSISFPMTNHGEFVPRRSRKEATPTKLDTGGIWNKKQSREETGLRKEDGRNENSKRRTKNMKRRRKSTLSRVSLSENFVSRRGESVFTLTGNERGRKKSREKRSSWQLCLNGASFFTRERRHERFPMLAPPAKSEGLAGYRSRLWQW